MIGAGSPEFYLLVTLFLCVQWERFSITRFTAADRRWSSRMVAVINLENGNPGLNPHHRMAFPLMYGYTSEKYPRCINPKSAGIISQRRPSSLRFTPLSEKPFNQRLSIVLPP